MLRTLFVLALTGVGAWFAVQSAFNALLFYIWIAYFRPYEWVWTDAFARFNLSLIAGLFLVAITTVSGQRWRFDGRTALLLLFLLQNVLSLMVGRHEPESWGYLQDFTKTIVITYFITILVSDRARFRQVLAVLALSLAFEPAKQAWAQLVLAPGTKNFNTIGFLGDESGVGVGMLMLVPILGVLSNTSTASWQKWGWRFLTLGVLYRAITTYSRGAFLALGMLAVMFVLRSRYKVRALVGAIVLAALIAPVLQDEFWDRMKTITTSEEEMDTSSRGRIHFWEVAISMANANPLTGVGHNSYNQFYDQYDFSQGEYGDRRSVHSVWFGMLAELGYPGLVLFILNLGAAFLACRKVRRMAREMPELSGLGQYATAMEVSFSAFAVASSFIIFQYIEMLWHFFGLSSALLAIAMAEQQALATQPARDTRTVATASPVVVRPAPVARMMTPPNNRGPI